NVVSSRRRCDRRSNCILRSRGAQGQAEPSTPITRNETRHHRSYRLVQWHQYRLHVRHLAHRVTNSFAAKTASFDAAEWKLRRVEVRPSMRATPPTRSCIAIRIKRSKLRVATPACRP